MQRAFQEFKRVLQPDGMFLASMLGGDTLWELRAACQMAEEERDGGFSLRTSPLVHVRSDNPRSKALSLTHFRHTYSMLACLDASSHAMSASLLPLPSLCAYAPMTLTLSKIWVSGVYIQISVLSVIVEILSLNTTQGMTQCTNPCCLGRIVASTCMPPPRSPLTDEATGCCSPCITPGPCIPLRPKTFAKQGTTCTLLP